MFYFPHKLLKEQNKTVYIYFKFYTLFGVEYVFFQLVILQSFNQCMHLRVFNLYNNRGPIAKLMNAIFNQP